MTDEPYVTKLQHEGHVISAQWRWKPLALARAPGQEEGGQGLGARDAAGAVARKFVIEWVDARFPSAAD